MTLTKTQSTRRRRRRHKTSPDKRELRARGLRQEGTGQRTPRLGSGGAGATGRCASTCAMTHMHRLHEGAPDGGNAGARSDRQARERLQGRRCHAAGGPSGWLRQTTRGQGGGRGRFGNWTTRCEGASAAPRRRPARRAGGAGWSACCCTERGGAVVAGAHVTCRMSSGQPLEGWMDGFNL